MLRVSVRDARGNLRALLERVQAGEEIAITRRGVEVARIVPPVRELAPFPDLAEFRASLAVRGEPVSETVIGARRDARY